MKIRISYFYQIRFFKPYQIPLSTAKWQPKWYGTKPYVDKNGVMNGLTARPFVLPDSYWENLVEHHTECGKNCQQSIPCNFMKYYYQYLSSLDFQDIYKRCEDIGNRVKERLGFEEEPEIILMVHEPKSCKCAERPVIVKWFADHGIDLKEYEK